MLLALYQSTLAQLDAGIDALRQDDQSLYAPIQLKAVEHLLLLVDGADAERSEVAGTVRDLCVFCMGQIAEPNLEKWTGARKVLATLCEGFEAIRQEGILLEASGDIPPLSLQNGQTLLHA